MNIQSETRGDVVVLRPVARIDSSNAGVFERAITTALDQGGTRMVIDFAQMEYISSAGLRATLIAGKRMRSVPGGRLVLCSLAPPVREIFEISGFVAIFTIRDDLDAAVAACE
ncbi:MAG: STAS domain-containing protein [Gammaproteobacteria bacterium]